MDRTNQQHTARKRAAFRRYMERLGFSDDVMCSPNVTAKPEELALAICPERWRLVRTTKMLAGALSQMGGVDGAASVRRRIMAALREALDGGGMLDEKSLPGEPRLDTPGLFRLAFGSLNPPNGHEAETAVAIVRRTLDSILGPEA